MRLTAKGRAAVDEAIGAQNALESDWFSVLSAAEQKQLLEMLERVLARIDQPAEGTVGG